MKHNIYSIFNELSINLDEYKKEDFNDTEKKLLKKNIRKYIKGRKLKGNIIICREHNN